MVIGADEQAQHVRDYQAHKADGPAKGHHHGSDRRRHGQQDVAAALGVYAQRQGPPFTEDGKAGNKTPHLLAWWGFLEVAIPHAPCPAKECS